MTLMIFIGLLVGMLMTLIVYGAYILLISFTIWMAVDAAKQDRYWWVVIVIGVPAVGPAVYYLTEKKHEYVKIESHHIHKSETEEQHESTPKKSMRNKKDNKVEILPKEDGVYKKTNEENTVV